MDCPCMYNGLPICVQKDWVKNGDHWKQIKIDAPVKIVSTIPIPYFTTRIEKLHFKTEK